MKFIFLFIFFIFQNILCEVFIPKKETDVSSVPPFYSNIVKYEDSLEDKQFLDLLEKKISLKMKDSKIDEIFEFLGTLTKINFIIDRDVKGKFSKIFIEDWSIKKIINFLCENNNPRLKVVRQEDCFRVMLKNIPNNKISFLKFFRIDNLKFDNTLEEKIKVFWDKITGFNDKNTYIIFESDSRKIFVCAPQDQLNIFENYIKEIDNKIPQVRIDAVIILANKSFECNFGFNWSGIYNKQQTIKAENKKFSFTGLGGRLIDFKNVTEYVNPNNFAINLISKCKNFLIKGSEIVKIPFVFSGTDLNTRRLNLLLEAAEAESKIKIISRPSVLTSNNEKAEILIGRSLPLQTIVEDVVEGKMRNVQTLNYKDIGTILSVTPNINLEKKVVTLDILVEDSDVSSGTTETNDSGILTNPPVVSTIRTKNKVILDDGQTTVIGGLIYNREEKGFRAVPFLHGIPIIGRFFSGKRKCKQEIEQIIFITPRIIK